jgi:cell division protein ZapB
MEKQNPERRRFLLIFLIISLVAAILLLLFLMQRNLSSQKSAYEQLLAEQKIGYEKDLKKLSDDLQTQIQKAKRLGEEKEELVDSLQKVFKDIQSDRENLRRNLNVTQNQLKQYKEKIDAYEILLRQKDKEIDKLRETADILYKENTKLKDDKNEIYSELSEEKKQREKLQGKIEEAAVLKAENIQVNAITDNGKEISGPQFRASRIDKLSMTFNLADNKVAKIGNKDIYMRLLEPAGTLLYNQGGNDASGEFEVDGKTMKYTARRQILFDNSRQNVNFTFVRSGQYSPGRYSVEFYAEGRRIGYGTFEVR